MSSEPELHYSDPLPIGADDTPYRLLPTQGVTELGVEAVCKVDVELARAESERGEVVLHERRNPDVGVSAASVLELRVNGAFVMDTFETSSEKGLATLARTSLTNGSPW